MSTACQPATRKTQEALELYSEADGLFVSHHWGQWGVKQEVKQCNVTGDRSAASCDPNELSPLALKFKVNVWNRFQTQMERMHEGGLWMGSQATRASFGTLDMNVTTNEKR